MPEYDVIVVGAGPAGLMSAGQAASQGKSTLLLEKMSSPARKLLLTGKGRCNLTNTAPIEAALLEFNRSGRFLTQLFYHFYHAELIAFFERLGVPMIEQRGGRVFPRSEKARDVAEALITWVERNGVTLQTGTRITDLVIEDQHIRGVITKHGAIKSKAVILSTGGKSYPGTGSTGDGYALAGQAGHTIRPLLPALVPLVTAGNTAKTLQGLSLKNISVSILIAGKKSEEMFGELMFTHFGLSGPVILTMSGRIVQALEKGAEVIAAIDLKPALSRETLNKRLLRDIQELGRKQFSTLLEELLPKKMIPVCCEQLNIPWAKKVSQISGEERKRLLAWLKGGFRFEITGHRGFDQAIITSGGVDTREIDPTTMESRIIQGLYFAGEIIDVHANTGGYNLQAAFSTGWAAGRSAGSPS